MRDMGGGECRRIAQTPEEYQWRRNSRVSHSSAGQSVFPRNNEAHTCQCPEANKSAKPKVHILHHEEIVAACTQTNHLECHAMHVQHNTMSCDVVKMLTVSHNLHSH